MGIARLLAICALCAVQDDAQIRALVEALDADDIEKRERAESALRAVGERAERLLEAAAARANADSGQRAKRLLDRIRWNRSSFIIPVLVRSSIAPWPG